MTPSRPFRIVYAPSVKRHLTFIEAKHRSLIREAIERQLFYEPDVPTRNRKPLRLPAAFEATWELRLGPGNRFRVLYDLNRDEGIVSVLAIGIKEGNVVRIAGEEITL